MGPLSMNPWDVAMRQQQAAQQAPQGNSMTGMPAAGGFQNALQQQLGGPAMGGGPPQPLGTGGVSSLTGMAPGAAPNINQALGAATGQSSYGAAPGGIPQGWQNALAQVGQAQNQLRAGPGGPIPLGSVQGLASPLPSGAALSPQAIQNGAGILAGRPLIRG